MAGWSGGTFTRARDWTDDEAGAVQPSATNFDEEDDNLASGINACLHKGGQNSPSANINWGTYKITNLGDPTSDQDAATKVYVDTELASPGAKAWARITHPTTVESTSYGVASVTNDATGTYTVTWSTAFSDTIYAVMALPIEVGTPKGAAVTCRIEAQVAGSVTLQFYSAAGADADVEGFSILAFGAV